MAKRDQMGLPIAAATDKLDREIKTKPVCFEDTPGCDAEYLQAKGKAAIDGSLGSALLSGMRSDGPTPGIFYPEPGQTNQHDADRTMYRWFAFKNAVRNLAVAGVLIYLIHSLPFVITVARR